MSKERLTKFVTPVGTPMTTLNSMKHYKPCVPCRHNAKLKTDSNGNQYTEKFDFCDTCEVKMLFNRLKEYEDLEEQGLLLRLPCKVGDTVWELCKCDDNVYRIFPMVVKQVIPDGSVRWIKDKEPTVWNIYAISDYTDMYKAFCDFGKTVFLTQSEAEERLRESEGK